ncbi:NAD(P)-binding protein [Venustampulla echinocandica]|uniref:NAD(P)-binding protein n=1 Tax=Venustampulla echinocandica TaxID=2656787 RepID=A0A370TNA3_9HELO|nr:NAD(P)-binding protein [Venustampulla echinocandica]RDL37006.1 NAD(P)-binding protein [Venustampulla echinocandica]
MAKALALNGAAKVYIIGRRQEVLESASRSVPTNNIIPIVGDVTSQSSLDQVVSKIAVETGYINLLVANAGIAGPGPKIPASEIKSVADLQRAFGVGQQGSESPTGIEEYVNTFTVNTAAVWHTIVSFLGLLDEGNKKVNVEQRSQVIATSSIGGFTKKPVAGYAYGQTKAATTQMMKQLAAALAPFGIRVNVLAPGFFLSDMISPLVGGGNFTRDQLPLERVGSDEDMAGCILFMASKAGAYCSGNVMVIDGGRLSVMPSTY